MSVRLLQQLDLALLALSSATCVVCDGPTSKGRCELCQRSAPHRVRTRSGLPVGCLGPYRGSLKRSIFELKFRGATSKATALAVALAGRFQQQLRGKLLVPVPLHPARLAERGYNQSALLARVISRHSQAQADCSVLRRRSVRARQASLGRRERLSNLQGAMQAQRCGEKRQAVVLVDDVVTTGATLDVAAQALRSQGFAVSGALCCARTPSQSELRAAPTKKQ